MEEELVEKLSSMNEKELRVYCDCLLTKEIERVDELIHGDGVGGLQHAHRFETPRRSGRPQG